MTNTDTHLEKFIEQATALLEINEANLKTLADQVQQQLALMSDVHTNGQRPSQDDLQYLQSQAHVLTNQNRSLRRFLENQSEKNAISLPPSRIQILQQQEEERTRIAKELEDSTGQLLANAIFELAAIKNIITSAKDHGEMMNGIDALQKELEEGLATLRFMVADLEPTATFGNFGLFAGLRRYLEKFEKQTGIKAVYQTHAVVEHLPDIIEVAIFRVIQEGLQNVRYHAQATEVKVLVNEEDTHLAFHIIDNGNGIQNQARRQNQRRLGLVGMQDLTELLEGQLQIK
ncbi:MAG: histidine kinase, partial [Chloroflexota bacterium]